MTLVALEGRPRPAWLGVLLEEMAISDTLVWLLGPFIDYMATKHRSLCMLLVVCPLSFVLRRLMLLGSLWFLVFPVLARLAA